MTSSRFVDDQKQDALMRAAGALRRRQHGDGHWLFELEADATITAEYVMLEHYMGRLTPERQKAMARHLRRKESAQGGGWPLYEGGPFDLSASVKAYFALKLVGDPIDAPHMARSRCAILAAGGARRANVFTRIQLALFGILPWHAVPAMPVELVLLPRKALFSIWAVSYWSRTCIVPLLVIQALRPRARNPRGLRLDELLTAPTRRRDRGSNGTALGWRSRLFHLVDILLRLAGPLHIRRLRAKAIDTAVAYVEERLNGEHGLGAIYPAMAYALMMYDALGRGTEDEAVRMVWRSLDLLVVETPHESYCQPCMSPIWDTSLAAHAMLEAVEAGVEDACRLDVMAACDWLVARQITTFKGDWAVSAPAGLEAGGWAFQYRNDHFPDVDDTSVVAMLLLRSGCPGYAASIEQARRWILGMQSRSGGWGAFDIDNDRDYLNEIPFADHGALLDPPTSDVTARCISFLARLGHPEDRPAIDRALAFLLSEQTADGSWFGRWGTNYVYGTWSALCALADAGLQTHPAVPRAVNWLTAIQRADGGWGEDESSYDVGCYVEARQAQPSQTAWAMLALMAAGQADSAAVKLGARWLEVHCRADGTWQEERNAVGFPRVFYLLYKGYGFYFPLLALSRYRKLQSTNPNLPCKRDCRSLDDEETAGNTSLVSLLDHSARGPT